jgi:PTS hybrid protein
VIGIVVVSHSPALAEAAVALALQMAGASPPRVVVAAGAGDGVLGTDAARVAAAIDEVATEEGVLVLMDLGSAVLSAEMALEFAETTHEVRLSAAPFVEGLVAAVVLAAAGASLGEVDREAAGAMAAKAAQLGDTAPAPAPEPAPVAEQRADAGAAVAEAVIVNDVGLHARPASLIVARMGDFDAEVTVSDADDPRRTASARSMLALMGLALAKGTRLRFTGSGADAAAAVEALRALTAEGYGELG